MIGLVSFGLLAAGLFKLSSCLETGRDSHSVPPECAVRNDTLPAVDFPLRTDKLTVEECLRYVKMQRPDSSYTSPTRQTCSPFQLDGNCNETGDPSNFSVFQKTYLSIGCGWEKPDILTEIHRNVSIISPNRAVTAMLRCRSAYTSDVLHYDVVHPIRNQTIELWIAECVSHNVTAMVYDMGVFPYLLRLDITIFASTNGGISIRQRDFSRMPQLRMIYFRNIIIEAMEPYTFTDLAHLQILALEARYLSYNLGASDSLDDLLMARRLYCDSAFAWFRHFLKEKPFLIGDKAEGEAFRLGDYFSPKLPFTPRKYFRQNQNVSCSLIYDIPS
ncbi:uncharacterized protein LOC129590696 [Paramacrobiotus metropolitanus]|uniref:uncharacterized protein LOC129590696 n=1 Tax=Paramacrobiotus metropolitanus TaxID=2943436 RepID=UPI002445EBAD|nr:uncharacterized protein LOC129590696 [Paramacrobiotus metropolitanus]